MDSFIKFVIRNFQFVIILFMLKEKVHKVPRFSASDKSEIQHRKQFYQDISEDDKVEFINGKVIMHSPVKRRHLESSGKLYRLLGDQVENHNLGKVYVEKAMIHLTHNSYEPDICFWKKELSDKFTDDQMLFPAPTLVVEILSPSTQKNDRGIKFIDYARHGVEEYWLIDPLKKTFEQYLLEGQVFKLHKKKGTKGRIQAKTITGFDFDIERIFNF